MDLNYFCLQFEELTTQQLYQILRLRQEVFVVEQNCPYLDVDGKDLNAFHILMYHNDILIAYARLLSKGISYPEHASIGRVINKSDYRGKGIGKLLMEYSIKKMHLLYPGQPIKISAQTYLDKFYSKLGFEKVGSGYLEDDIPHQAMVYKS